MISKIYNKVSKYLEPKSEVVKVLDRYDGYGAKYRRFWEFEWRYIGMAHSFPESNLDYVYAFCLTDKDTAEKRLEKWKKRKRYNFRKDIN